MTFSKQGRKLPVEALRPKFWEVAAKKPLSFFDTPFMEKRIEKGMTHSEVAVAMVVPEDDYRLIESGKAYVSYRHILAFCVAMNCHVLDLYNDPGPKVPLPDEIFDSLIFILDHAGYNRHEKMRAMERLDEETRRGFAMIKAHTNDLMPLFTALGFSSKHDYLGSPYVSHTSPVRTEAWKKRAPNFIDRLIDNDGRTRPDLHIYIGNCLNAYQLEMESDCEIHNGISGKFVSEYNKNHDFMMDTAKEIFGDGHTKKSIDTLRRWVQRTDPKDHEALRETFVTSPSDLSVWPLHKVKRALQDKGSDLGKYYAVHLRALFQAIVVDERHKNQAAMNGVKIAKAYQDKLDHFIAWRQNPNTLRLLSWFIHRGALTNRSDLDEKEIRAWNAEPT